MVHLGSILIENKEGVHGQGTLSVSLPAVRDPSCPVTRSQSWPSH